ncbi:MAG: hypothetical protein M3Y72_25215 [Acidobacteriota bacterium]|nr:hypothetical protein [Acidobacteriota bacterium]
MPEARVRMDPLNPGQFFACCGLFELLAPDADAVASFDFDAQHPRHASFVVQGKFDSLCTVIEQLSKAKPRFEGTEPATRIVELSHAERPLTLDWWLDEFREKTTPLKCWAGQVTTENLVCELLSLLAEQNANEHLFDVPAMTKAKFGVDPRSAWNALDFGFSPNEHGRDSAVFPAVDILAAIGLQTFRPDTSRREKVRYSLWTDPLPVCVARLAFRNPWDGLPARSYEFGIRSRGQSYKYFTFGKDSPKEGENE